MADIHNKKTRSVITQRISKYYQGRRTKSGNSPRNNISKAWLELTPCFRQVER